MNVALHRWQAGEEDHEAEDQRDRETDREQIQASAPRGS